MDSTSEYEDKYRALSEKRIREAIDAGEFDNVARPGAQVDVEENPFVPEEWRLAFHVLKQNGFKPEWITLAEEIDADIDAWRRSADQHFSRLRGRLADVVSDPRGIQRLPEEVAGLKASHARATARHADALKEINRKINYFNATVPIQSLKRSTFSPEEEMRRFAERLPAYLNY